MSNCVSCSPVASLTAPNKPGILISRNPVLVQKITFSNEGLSNFATSRSQATVVKATTDKPTTKVSSILCKDCEGNGVVQCGQCEGGGVNLKDHFNGRFKEGGLCWLCRGKREVLCGSCNGAGFMGGFMSTGDS